MESVLPRSVLFVEDIEGLAAEYRDAYIHRGRGGHDGLEAAEAAAAESKRGGRADQDQIFARPSSPHRAAGHLDLPRALGDKSNETPPAALLSQYRQR